MGGIGGTRSTDDETPRQRARRQGRSRRMAVKACTMVAACSILASVPLLWQTAASAMVPVQIQASPAMAGTVNHGNVGQPVFCWQYIGPSYVGVKWHYDEVAVAGTDKTGPDLAKVGGDLVIVSGGSDNSLSTWWQPAANFVNGTNGAWAYSVIATNGAAYSAPWVVEVGKDALVAVQGPDNSLEAYVTSDDGAQWSSEQVAGVATTYDSSIAPPEAAVVDGTTMIASEGPDHELLVYVQAPGTTTWQQEKVADAAAYSPPTIAQIGTSAVVAVRGPNQTLTTYTQGAGTTTWVAGEVAGAGTAKGQPSLTAVNGTSAALNVWAPGNAMLTWTEAPGGTWRPDPMPAAGAGPNEVFHAPNVTQIGKYLAVLFQGPNFLLSLYWQKIGTTSWQLVPIV